MNDTPEEHWRCERRGRLLDAASRVFARHSYEQASMGEIAREAGVGKPTLYRYFPGKEALFGAVFVQALDDLEVRLARVLATRNGAADRLLGLVAEMIPTFKDHLVSLRLLNGDAASAGQSRRRIFGERRARIAALLARAVEEGVEAGELRRRDAGRTAQLIIGLVWSGAASIRDDADGIAHEIVDLVLHGVLADAGADGRWSEPHSAAARGNKHPSPGEGSWLGEAASR